MFCSSSGSSGGDLMEGTSRSWFRWCNTSSGTRRRRSSSWLLFELSLGSLCLFCWYWGRWLFWNCIILGIRQHVYLSENCWVWDHPKVGPVGMVLIPVTINSIRILNAIGWHDNIEKNKQNCTPFRNRLGSILLFRKYLGTVSEVFGCILGYLDTVCENWFKPSPNGPIRQVLHTI